MGRHGLTLIECLVAMAITAMLAVAAFHVTGALGRSAAANRRAERAARLGEGLRRLLARDLVHARRVRAVEGALEIETLASLGADDGAPRHAPVVVRYERVTVGDGSVLVRRERDADGNASAGLAALGAGPVTAEPEGDGPRADRDGWVPVGRAVRVRVQVTGGQAVGFTVRRW